MINHRKFVDLPSWKMGGFSIINNSNTGWWLSSNGNDYPIYDGK